MVLHKVSDKKIFCTLRFKVINYEQSNLRPFGTATHFSLSPGTLGFGPWLVAALSLFEVFLL